MTRANDPALVARQYASEANLRARQAIYANRVGPDAREVAFEAVAEARPERVLEVGGGQGELSERIARELGLEVVMVDQSARMVELARGRGVDAVVGDVQDLPFDDESFDVAVAAWMLYHVPDVDRGIAELARVLRPGGRLVAVTNGRDHLRELRSLAVERFWATRPFARENGEEQLRRRFGAVERRDVEAETRIDDDTTIMAYLESLDSLETPTELPEHELPLRIRTSVCVFVATK